MATENELRSLSRKRQSPIDICDKIAREKELPALKLIGHWMNEGEAILSHDGHHARILLGGDRIPSIIKCGPLRDEYEFHNTHFHWGEDNCMGSEHSINGTWFSMEAHAVHWNRKYRTFDESLKYEDGLCILAYFFLVKDMCDCECIASMENITDNLHNVAEPGGKVKIPANSLYWMRAATQCDYYYFYKGSLTGGSHQECVIWIIFSNVLPIRADQMAEFRKIKNEKGHCIMDNRRRRQHLCGRKIYKAV